MTSLCLGPPLLSLLIFVACSPSVAIVASQHVRLIGLLRCWLDFNCFLQLSLFQCSLFAVNRRLVAWAAWSLLCSLLRLFNWNFHRHISISVNLHLTSFSLLLLLICAINNNFYSVHPCVVQSVLSVVTLYFSVGLRHFSQFVTFF